MFAFHAKRWIAGRELVGMNTCGSTLSNACSRSFIAYFAKSPAVAYGEVDCSSPKTFGAPATARLKQTARSLLITNAVIFYPIPRFQARRIFPIPIIFRRFGSRILRSSKIALVVLNQCLRWRFTHFNLRAHLVNSRFLLGQPRDDSFRCFLLLRDCSLEIFSLLRHR